MSGRFIGETPGFIFEISDDNTSIISITPVGGLLEEDIGKFVNLDMITQFRPQNSQPSECK